MAFDYRSLMPESLGIPVALNLCPYCESDLSKFIGNGVVQCCRCTGIFHYTQFKQERGKER